MWRKIPSQVECQIHLLTIWPTLSLDVYHSLSSEVQFALIPKENSIFGPVVESYDLLRSRESDYDAAVSIREEITLQVKHRLIVRKGVTLRDITHVLSHEQVTEVKI